MTRHLLVIGAQRCGTTYLAAMLDSHPDITMARPARPEPKVFLSDELAGRGLDWYHATFFGHARQEQLLGEKTTSYLEHPDAAARAAAVLGDDVAIVAQLRDPVARAVSNWRFSARHTMENRPLVQALEESLDGPPREWDRSLTSVSPYSYLERGRYVDQLEPWFARFPESVHVTFLDDGVARSPSLHAVYAAVGVDPGHSPTGLRDAVNESDGEAPTIGKDLDDRLREYFRDSDERLQDRLGRTLPWTSLGRRPQLR